MTDLGLGMELGLSQVRVRCAVRFRRSCANINCLIINNFDFQGLGVAPILQKTFYFIISLQNRQKFYPPTNYEFVTEKLPACYREASKFSREFTTPLTTERHSAYGRFLLRLRVNGVRLTNDYAFNNNPVTHTL